MQDPDDFFTDDIIFDDQTLAILDECEQKFVSQRAAAPKRDSPPTKRQKTAHESGARRYGTAFVEDWEDLPEISVHGDGTYGLQQLNAALSVVTNRPTPQVPVRRVNGPVAAPVQQAQFVARPPIAAAQAGPSRVPAQAITRAPSSSSQNRSSSFRHQNARPLTRNTTPSRSNQSAPLVTKPTTTTATSAVADVSQDEAAQVAELRRQMEELRESNKKLNVDLQAAIDVKYAREGEVTILRKGIEKTAQDHAAQVARLKAAKEEADAKQSQLQKEMKEEIERLRTQFTFKQHELETSNKGTWSVSRPRQINRDPPQTPSHVQSLRTQAGAGIAGPSKPPQAHPPLAQIGFPGADKTNRNRRLQSDSEDVKPVMLPGFQNAFGAPSPAPPKRLDKGKAREVEPIAATQEFYFPTSDFQSQANLFFQHSTPRSQRRTTDMDTRIHNLGKAEDQARFLLTKGSTDEDVNMLADEFDVVQPFSVDVSAEPYSWRAEPHQIILTHSHPLHMTPTLQVLLGITPPHLQADTYRAACANVLDVLSSPLNTMSALCRPLLSMAHILNLNRFLHPLTALMSLLSCLAISQSSFCPFLLSERPANIPAEQSTPLLIQLLHEIVHNHLIPPKPPDENYAPDIQALCKGTMNFLDALCWMTPDEHAEKLSCIPLNHEMLSLMLDASQPAWMLVRSARILVILATHASLYRPLTSLPHPINEHPHKEGNRIGYLERLCSFLIDSRRRSKDVDTLKILSLTFVALVSVAHADALVSIAESPTLIPSLVVFLTQLTTPLWEDDDVLMLSPDMIASSVRTINQTLLLLHHIVFSAGAVFNLRHKLVHAPHRQFNGIIHMFIVTLGRLSYADPPDWVDSGSKLELERLTDIARDLLELLVEGPEGDSVWEAYQGVVVESSEVDEEEPFI